MTNEPTMATRPLEPKRTAIVIGASSGIGAALALELAGHGYTVAAVARREDRLLALQKMLEEEQASDSSPHHPDAPAAGRILAYCHDVTQFDDVPGLFQVIVRDLGGLDVIAYVAGIQPAVSLDEFNFDKDEAIIRTNLSGAIAWLNQAAVRFERAGSGHIVGVSSVAGDRGRVGTPVYNSSKAGLNTYLEALRNRLTRHGVAVTTIKPGFVDTVLLENSPRTFWVISPQAAARQIHQAIRRKKQTVYVPARWGLVGLIIRHIPSLIFRRLNF